MVHCALNVMVSHNHRSALNRFTVQSTLTPIVFDDLIYTEQHGYVALANRNDTSVSPTAYYCEVYTSTDGNEWQLRSQTPMWGTPSFGRFIKLINGRFYIGISSNTVRSDVLWYADDIDGTWATAHGIETRQQSALDVAFGNGVYVLTTQVDSTANGGYAGIKYRSTDGVYWTKITGYDTILAPSFVYFVDGTFYALGSDSVVSTDDGLTWTSIDIGSSGHALTSGAYGDGKFVMVGTSGAFFVSLDGTNWMNMTSSSPFQTSTIWAITYSYGRFLACGDQGKIRTSIDGINWTNVPSGVSYPLNKGIAGTPTGSFVIVCSNRAVLKAGQ